MSHNLPCLPRQPTSTSLHAYPLPRLPSPRYAVHCNLRQHGSPRGCPLQSILFLQSPCINSQGSTQLFSGKFIHFVQLNVFAVSQATSINVFAVSQDVLAASQTAYSPCQPPCVGDIFLKKGEIFVYIYMY